MRTRMSGRAGGAKPRGFPLSRLTLAFWILASRPSFPTTTFLPHLAAAAFSPMSRRWLPFAPVFLRHNQSRTPLIVSRFGCTRRRYRAAPETVLTGFILPLPSADDFLDVVIAQALDFGRLEIFHVDLHHLGDGRIRRAIRAVTGLAGLVVRRLGRPWRRRLSAAAGRQAGESQYC